MPSQVPQSGRPDQGRIERSSADELLAVDPQHFIPAALELAGHTIPFLDGSAATPGLKPRGHEMTFWPVCGSSHLLR
jgi:hypothetical protein